MNLLLDTHALLWWLYDDPKLSGKARTAIEKPAQRVFVSSASAWEITTKVRIGKLPEVGDVADKLSAYLRRDARLQSSGFTPSPSPRTPALLPPCP